MAVPHFCTGKAHWNDDRLPSIRVRLNLKPGIQYSEQTQHRSGSLRASYQLPLHRFLVDSAVPSFSSESTKAT